MKKTLITIILSLGCLVSMAQSFEGLVVYHTTFKSKIPNMTDEQMAAWGGDTVKYYMKGGNYRSDGNGTAFKWQIYVNKDNRMYDKNDNTDTVLWTDCAINTDTLYHMILVKNADKILGYNCDEWILETKHGTTKYFFSSAVRIDSKLYARQAFQNWFAYLNRSNAMPLQIIGEYPQGTEVMRAASVTKMKLDDSLFKLPAGIVLKKDAQ